MSTKSFLAYHGLLIIGLALLPHVLLFLAGRPVFNLVQLLGLTAIALSLAASAELAFGLLTSFLYLPLRKVCHFLWGLSVFPFGLAVLIEFKLRRQLQLHLDFDVIKLSLLNLADFWPVISTEIDRTSWLVAAALLAVGLAVSILGWRSVSRPLSISQRIIATSSLLVIISVIAGQRFCPPSPNQPSNAPASLSSFQKAMLLACPPSAAPVDAGPPPASWLRLKKLAADIVALPDPILARPLRPDRSLGSPSTSPPPNIVIVALESFRNDATTPYNQPLDTTPFLQQMATEGLIVEDEYVDHPHTSKSLISLLCGMPTYPAFKLIENRPDGLPYQCLPDLLRPLGYSSAYFQPSTSSWENRDQLAANMSFDHFTSLENLDDNGWEYVNYFGLEDRSLLPPVMQWVDGQKSPFLLTLLTLSSHHPYHPPASFTRHNFTDNETLNSYYNTIRYTDDFLRELFQEFSARGLVDNTVFVFISDHGVGRESLLETAYPRQENVRVPLIIWNRRFIPKPLTVQGYRQHSDLVPTLVDLLDFDAPQDQFYGQSLLQSVNNRPLFLNCKFGNCRVMYFDNFKFVQHNNGNLQLFDLAQDPEGAHDLASFADEKTLDQFNQLVTSWKEQVLRLYD